MSDPLAPLAPPAPVETESSVQKPSMNKKAIILIAALFVIGVIVGLILSSFFVNETNDIIQQINNQPYFPGDYPYLQQPLTMDQIILPTFGVVIVCISMLLLVGTIAVYIKIGLKTKSRYIVGLLIFLTPLLVETAFSLSALRSLFISAVIPYERIRWSIGFGFGGFGGVLVVTSVFETIGLTMLLYLSTE